MINFGLIFLFLFSFIKLHSIPGKIISYESTTHIPIVSLTSLDLENYEKLKVFRMEDLPKGSNWQDRISYYENRNRIVYVTRDHKFVLKVWQKNYPSKDNFLSALRANFYEGITLLTALIFDNDNECRGYILPYMIDRMFNRVRWESFGFILEKNKININIFSKYEVQPQIYKELFDKLIDRAKNKKYVSLDFCPDNIAINLDDKQAYLIDLEDVQLIAKIEDELISKIFFKYLSEDYLKAILSLEVR